MKSLITEDPTGVLKSWLTNTSPCGSATEPKAWEGITCSSTGGRVTEIYLSNRGLSGTINGTELETLPGLIKL